MFDTLKKSHDEDLSAFTFFVIIYAQKYFIFHSTLLKSKGNQICSSQLI